MLDHESALLESAERPTPIPFDPLDQSGTAWIALVHDAIAPERA
jgi:hypothetical protein